jgi:predicted ATP-grasp superfamily ATP-dependent carboligase
MKIVSRSAFPVLVTDVHAIGMIGVVRALGGAGYPVIACDVDQDALGFSSNFVKHALVCPPYGSREFIEWLRKVVIDYEISSIIPSEGFLVAVRNDFDEFSPLLPTPAVASNVYDCLSKTAVIGKFIEVNQTMHLPKSYLICSVSQIPDDAELGDLSFPLFVKGDAADARAGRNGFVKALNSIAEARRLIQENLSDYRRVLVQEFVPGEGVGAYFLIQDGVIKQEFMNRCIHEVPHTGGFCSLRDSWWNESIMSDARERIRSLNWEGVAMLEYRWDERSNDFWFVELNARFWAALHVALYCGVNFPVMLVDGMRGADVAPVSPFARKVSVRYTFPFEIGYVMSRWRDKKLSFLSKIFSVGEWFYLFFDFRTKSDLFFPGDRKLYLIQAMRFVKGLFK